MWIIAAVGIASSAEFDKTRPYWRPKSLTTEDPLKDELPDKIVNENLDVTTVAVEEDDAAKSGKMLVLRFTGKKGSFLHLSSTRLNPLL